MKKSRTPSDWKKFLEEHANDWDDHLDKVNATTYDAYFADLDQNDELYDLKLLAAFFNAQYILSVMNTLFLARPDIFPKEIIESTKEFAIQYASENNSRIKSKYLPDGAEVEEEIKFTMKGGDA